MAKTAMYALGAIIVLIILYLIFIDNSSGFVGSMAKNAHDVRLRYPHPGGQRSGWIFNRGTWV